MGIFDKLDKHVEKLIEKHGERYFQLFKPHSIKMMKEDLRTELSFDGKTLTSRTFLGDEVIDESSCEIVPTP